MASDRDSNIALPRVLQRRAKPRLRVRSIHLHCLPRKDERLVCLLPIKVWAICSRGAEGGSRLGKVRGVLAGASVPDLRRGNREGLCGGEASHLLRRLGPSNQSVVLRGVRLPAATGEQVPALRLCAVQDFILYVLPTAMVPRARQSILTHSMLPLQGLALSGCSTERTGS